MTASDGTRNYMDGQSQASESLCLLGLVQIGELQL